MNTRFNPTTNGPLHVGHLYLCLLNRQMAHDAGGKFIVRFADDEEYWVKLQGEQAMMKCAQGMKDDLAWAGVEPDFYTYQSDHADEDGEFIRPLGKLDRQEDLPINLPADPGTITDYSDVYLSPKTKITPIAAPYMPHSTALKVAQDYREGCDPIVRGEELITEFSLYVYFCRALGIPVPRHFCAPRLKTGTGDDLDDISKSKGTFSIKQFREHGCAPDILLGFLETCCLKEPRAGWTFENLKARPVVPPFLWPDVEAFAIGYDAAKKHEPLTRRQ